MYVHGVLRCSRSLLQLDLPLSGVEICSVPKGTSDQLVASHDYLVVCVGSTVVLEEIKVCEVVC